MAYATTTEVFDRMGYSDPLAPALVGRVSDAIDAATVAIDNDTGRSFSPATETRTFAGCGHDLRVPDLVSITALRVDDDDDGVFETTIAASGFELLTDHSPSAWPYEVVRLLDRTWPTLGRRTNRIEIEGVWGWEAVPTPINQACSLLAARLSQRANSALFGIQSFGDLGAQGIRSTDPDYEMLIAPYRLPGVA